MKARYILSYPAEVVEEPILYELVKRFDLKINILRAEIDSGKKGSMLVELESETRRIEQGLEYLRGLGVGLRSMAKGLLFKEELCVACGACTGVCPSGALRLDPETALLILDRDECVACGRCVKACPLRLFALEFGD
jgi:ferredoxin